MNNLYSYKGAYPFPLPRDIENYNINDFVPAPAKPTLTPGQQLEWINNQWSIRDPNAAELEIKWQEVRNERNRKLAESDVLVLKCYEQGIPVTEELAAYRNALRNIPQAQTNPFNIVWPIL
jgi:hypothetical protein